MVQVRVNEGLLEGELTENEFGGTFYSFKGIPYAEPPVNDLRFKAPQPPKPWDGVRSAKAFGPVCYQYDLFTKAGLLGSEDCLYLNVYSPEVKPSKPLPVMVWIHGGAFICGSGNDDIYSPEFLVRKGVIVVTINYRLEVLGFLCLDTPEVPGNAGMKDQVAALRWVKKNISNFGGDPSNITIFGESAGGASVSFHLLSPMSKGLFKRAIPQSGSSTSDWSQTFKPRERAFALGRKLGLFTNDVNELYEFLKKQPVESLALAHVPILLAEKGISDVSICFSIVDEKKFGNQERFFYGDVYDNLRQGIHEGVDVLTGYTTDEGLVNFGSPDEFEKKLQLARHYVEYFVPAPMKVTLSAEQQLEVGQTIKKYYFKSEDLSAADWEQLSNFYSMNMFIYGTIQFSKLCASKKKNNIYLYKFSCKSERNLIAHMFGATSIIGDKPVTCHADDTLYLFNSKLVPSKVDVNSKTFELIDRVSTIWSNFAKYGNPTPDGSLGVQWPVYTLENEEYVDIGNELSVGTAPDAEEIRFWEDIFKKYAPNRVFQ